MKNLLLCFLLFALSAGAQTPEQLLPHLQAIVPKAGVVCYNVAGVDVVQLKSAREFEPKSFLRDFKLWGLMSKDLTPVTHLTTTAFYASKPQKSSGGGEAVTHYYFLKIGEKDITGLQFTGWKDPDSAFEKTFIQMLLQKPIPRSAFLPAKFDSIDFAGRKFWTGNSCYWTNALTAQCPHIGEMNWSLHPSLESAVQTTTNQYKSLRDRRGGKIVREDSVAVLFEGEPAQAHRIVYDFTGIRSALITMAGAKTLTIYYVAAPVRKHFVSWTASFWDTDVISKETRLPPLLEQVMKLAN